MKKVLFVAFFALATILQAAAVPVYPHPVEIKQPDGTTLTIQGYGDEFHHFFTTADGYTVVQNEQGYYVYAQVAGDALQPTEVVAHDAGQRDVAENAFLSMQSKMQYAEAAERSANKARKAVATRESSSYYKNFRGLVILVNFNDKQFTRSDAQEFYTHMLNDENYAGYKNENGTTNTYGNMFIGGVRDYYNANSNGIFVPQFDVVGPVTVDMGAKDVQSTSNVAPLWRGAITALDSIVDFSKYDADGDGTVDMVFFLVAGYGANYSGNNSNYLWPHKSSLFYDAIPTCDGKNFGTYACSTELYGWESQRTKIIDGIGTICHEFSHVLGLPDLYDTDYTTNGSSHDPGAWDVMANGSYNQYGRLPVGYSAFERYASGFLNFPVISAEGKYTLRELQQYHEGFILKTPVAKEFFILENRQQTGWDQQLPGHGMVVARVDSTSTSIWQSNKVNAYSSHNYYELLRAGGGTSGAASSDPFPGTKKVTTITNSTTANLKTWAGKDNDYVIKNITESSGTISFEVAISGDNPMGVDVDEVNFPDEKFREWVIANVAGADDKFLTWAELAAVTSIDCSEEGISSLTGIEYFTNLTSLLCEDNEIDNVNLYKNASLKKLVIGGNHLETLNLDNNQALTYITCEKNNLLTLNLSRCANSISGFNGKTQKRTLEATTEMIDSVSTAYVITLPLGFYNDESRGTYVDNLVGANLIYKLNDQQGYYLIIDPKEKPKTITYDYYVGNATHKLSVVITPVYPASQVGDVNDDGNVDTSDITALINRILGTDNWPDDRCDVNGDGKVDTSDITALIALILS